MRLWLIMIGFLGFAAMAQLASGEESADDQDRYKAREPEKDIPWFRGFTPVWLVDTPIPLIGDPHPIYDDFPALARPENADKLYQLALVKPDDEATIRALIAALSMPEGIPLALKLKDHECASKKTPKYKITMAYHPWRPFMRGGGFIRGLHLPAEREAWPTRYCNKPNTLQDIDALFVILRDVTLNLHLHRTAATRPLSVYTGDYANYIEIYRQYDFPIFPGYVWWTHAEHIANRKGASIELLLPLGREDAQQRQRIEVFSHEDHPLSFSGNHKVLLKQAVMLSIKREELDQYRKLIWQQIDGIRASIPRLPSLKDEPAFENIDAAVLRLRLDPPRGDLARRAALAALIDSLGDLYSDTPKYFPAAALKLLADEEIRAAAYRIPTKFQVDVATIQNLIRRIDPKGLVLDDVGPCILEIEIDDDESAFEKFRACVALYPPASQGADQPDQKAPDFRYMEETDAPKSGYYAERLISAGEREYYEKRKQ